MRFRLWLVTLATLVLTHQCLRAQQIGKNSSGNTTTYTMSVRTQLIVETVVVKDKQGHPIDGLTAKDFTLTEDGVPQTIRFAEHQNLPTTVAPLPPPKPDQEDITIYRQLAGSQFATEKSGDLRYKDHRLLAFYFDMSAMPPADQQRALAAAEKFIRTQMTEADRVSILRYAGGSVDILQDFTDDRNRLLSILETLLVGEGQGSAEELSDAATSDTGAAFGQDSGEFNIFNTDRQLAALQTTANMLSQLSEKKSLLYFSSGLHLNGVNNQAQLHATIDAALRAGVSFWPIDARGLVAGAPLGDASVGSPGNQGMYSGAAAQAVQSRFQQSQDTLFSLAGDTGGKALFDNNDLTRGMIAAQQSTSSYYVLGYYSTNQAQDGRYRRIKIALNPPREGISVDFRQGYYAAKTFDKFTATDKERQLEDALLLGEPITELTIAMELNYFQLNRAEYFVPIVVKIPGRELALAKKSGAEHTLIDFIGEIKDDYGGSTVSNVRDNVNIKLTDATAADLANRPIEYDTGFTLLPGKYTIKFLARDDETGRIGTYQTSFTIPNLNKETQRVPISSVVLAAQRVEMKDALYNAMKEKDRVKEIAANPLVVNDEKLIPSVTRVFSRARNLYVYLQAYSEAAPASPSTPGATPKAASTAAKSTTQPIPSAAVDTSPASDTTQPIVAYVSLYTGGQKAFETRPIVVPPNATNRLGTRPLTFTLAPKNLPPGEYDCQVTILDLATHKSNFWRGTLLFVP
jgi:VWFA-related protein